MSAAGAGAEAGSLIRHCKAAFRLFFVDLRLKAPRLLVVQERMTVREKELKGAKTQLQRRDSNAARCAEAVAALAAAKAEVRSALCATAVRGTLHIECDMDAETSQVAVKYLPRRRRHRQEAPNMNWWSTLQPYAGPPGLFKAG